MTTLRVIVNVNVLLGADPWLGLSIGLQVRLGSSPSESAYRTHISQTPPDVVLWIGMPLFVRFE